LKHILINYFRECRLCSRSFRYSACCLRGQWQYKKKRRPSYPLRTIKIGKHPFHPLQRIHAYSLSHTGSFYVSKAGGNNFYAYISKAKTYKNWVTPYRPTG